MTKKTALRFHPSTGGPAAATSYAPVASLPGRGDRRRTGRVAARRVALGNRSGEQAPDTAWRTRQLDCLLGVAELCARHDASLEEIGERVLALLVATLPNSATATGRLVLGDGEFKAGDHHDTPWQRGAAIVVAGKPVGRVEAGFLVQPRGVAEECALEDLPRLLGAVADRLGALVEQRQSRQLLRTFSQAVEELQRTGLDARDIIVVEQTDAELRHAHDRLATMLELSGELLSTTDLPSLLALILDKLALVVPYDRAAILALEDERLRVVASAGYPAESDVTGVTVVTADFSAIHEMITTKEPLCFPDAGCAAREAGQTIEAITGLPAAIVSPDTCSWLGTPLLARGEVIGVICLGHHEAAYYDPALLHVVQTFGNGAAIAISNAHLYQRAHSRATAEERSRLAHELHDSVTQALFSANLIATALPETYERDHEEAAVSLQKLLRLIRGALAQMRTLLVELVPEGLNDEELSVLLGHLSTAMAAEIGAPVELELEGECDLAPEQRIALYRIAQEALYNVAKHAGASRVVVRLACSEGTARLEVCDNGAGFTPGSTPASHMGVKIMRSRAEKIGAVLDIDSQVGQGTRITVTLEKGARGEGNDHS